MDNPPLYCITTAFYSYNLHLVFLYMYVYCSALTQIVIVKVFIFSDMVPLLSCWTRGTLLINVCTIFFFFLNNFHVIPLLVCLGANCRLTFVDGLWFFSPLKQRDISTRSCWLMTFILSWNVTLPMGAVSSKMAPPPATRHEDSPNGLMSIKKITWHTIL